MSQRPSGTPRLRVLCLHSFRTSAASFKKQLFELSNIGEALADLIELDLIDAPHECTPEEEERIEPGVKVIFGGPFYEWINVRRTRTTLRSASIVTLTRHSMRSRCTCGLLALTTVLWASLKAVPCATRLQCSHTRAYCHSHRRAS